MVHDRKSLGSAENRWCLKSTDVQQNHVIQQHLLERCLNVCKCVVPIISTFLFKFALCSSRFYSSLEFYKLDWARLMIQYVLFFDFAFTSLRRASERVRLGCLTTSDWVVADGMTGVSFRHFPAFYCVCIEKFTNVKAKNKIIVILAGSAAASVYFVNPHLALGAIWVWDPWSKGSCLWCTFYQTNYDF